VKRNYILPIFLIFQILALQVLTFFPEFVEKMYSNGIYQWISGFSRSILGKIPFSVGDVLYMILIFLAFRWLVKNRKNWRTKWKENLLKITSIISLAYFLFHLLWALNYYRVPLYQKMNIRKEYSENDLIAFTKKLIDKTNTLHNQIVNNDSIKVKFPYSQAVVFEKNLNGYNNLAEEYPFFSYSRSSVKKSLWSLPLTYMGFSGYMNPFTGEAQINDRMPMYNFPSTACHEMAHQMGYGSESECNFIGFLASIKNDDLYFQYSGYTMALKYCLSTLERMEKGKSKTFLPLIHKGILKNFDESKQFWKSHETFIETGFKVFYDNFLKMNQQKDGLEGYSKFVDLMVNYYKNKPL